jgi:hypothetical protein
LPRRSFNAGGSDSVGFFGLILNLVGFLTEPKIKKPNVYAETVASFGNFHVSGQPNTRPNNCGATTSDR